MKKFLFLISVIFFTSCCCIKRDAHIAMYKWEGFGELPSKYIILRFDDQIYTLITDSVDNMDKLVNTLLKMTRYILLKVIYVFLIRYIFLIEIVFILKNF